MGYARDMVWFFLGLASAGIDVPERLRLRFEKKADRCEAALIEAEGAWRTACVALEETEASRRDQRRADRTTRRLIGKRARHVRAAGRLVALGDPEAHVDVFFATNRTRDEARFFGTQDGGELVYGVATVYIPPNHPDGALERELQVAAVETFDEQTFHARLAEASDDGARLLSYVHGYNNSFEYAARRAAQVSHDLDAPLVPVLFSWPTRGGTWFATVKYTYDENAAARSSSAYAQLLGGLLAEHDEQVVVFAHSMGNRVVSEALVDLDRLYRLRRPIDRLILAAPDVDATVFERRYLDVATAASGGVTLYCAADDRALKLSRGVHGGYDRLGSCRDGAVGAIGERVEVVDASMLYVDLVDHDKVASSPRLLRDLDLVLDGVEAEDERRGLERREGRFELPP